MILGYWGIRVTYPLECGRMRSKPIEHQGRMCRSREYPGRMWTVVPYSERVYKSWVDVGGRGFAVSGVVVDADVEEEEDCWREDRMEACEGSRRVVSMSAKMGTWGCVDDGSAGGIVFGVEEAIASHADFSSSRLRCFVSWIAFLLGRVWRMYRLISSSSSCSVIWFFSF